MHDRERIEAEHSGAEFDPVDVTVAETARKRRGSAASSASISNSARHARRSFGTDDG
jgi:hypothetical protein